MVEFEILRASKSACNKLAILDFRRADFREVCGRVT